MPQAKRIRNKCTKLLRRAFLLTIPLAVLFSATAFAESTYTTYIYTNHGKNIELTPDAYAYDRIYTGEDLGAGALAKPQDLFVDSQKNIYIADTDNNRIVILDSEYRLKKTIAAFENGGKESQLNGPKGVFVTPKGELYISDTNNGRIVKFDAVGNFVQEFSAPDVSVLGLQNKDFAYRPTALSVDAKGRMYVIAQAVNMGIMLLSSDGTFQGFVGAPKVSYSVTDYMWKKFLTASQQERMTDFVPTQYNNITSDEKGFLFVTMSAINRNDLLADIANPSTSPTVAAVRRFNPSGVDVLRRNGSISISGDLKTEGGPSVIIDVATGPAQSYTLLDARGKYFTYSYYGDMLFAFSVASNLKPNAAEPTALFYKDDDLLVLDAAAGKIILYKPTEYGKLIFKALDELNHFQFDESVETWKELLKLNANMDLAYTGIGQAQYQSGNFKEAMQYYKMTDNKAAYSDAYSGYRQTLINKYFFLFFLIFCAVLFAVYHLYRLVARSNVLAESEPNRRGRLLSRILYGQYVAFHPVDGFWCLKNEKRGNVWSATILLILAALSLTVNQYGSGYLFSSAGSASSENSLLYTIASIVVPVLLWTLANWCLTSLMDGEGGIRDIYISVCYALIPYSIGLLLAAAVSHVLSAGESMYISFFTNTGLIWTLILIFFGSMGIHNYSVRKNVAVAAMSIVGMGVIIFLSLLVLTILQRMWGFVGMVYKELLFRS